MISPYNSKVAVLCDGCDIEVIFAADEIAAAFELRQQRWVVNTAARGWRHFCASCAVEFGAREQRQTQRTG